MSDHPVSESTLDPDERRVAIVIGAATGIGRAAAAVFADRGYAVVAVDISTQALAWTRDHPPNLLAGRGCDGAPRSHHGRKCVRGGIGNSARGPRFGRPLRRCNRCNSINIRCRWRLLALGLQRVEGRGHQCRQGCRDRLWGAGSPSERGSPGTDPHRDPSGRHRH